MPHNRFFSTKELKKAQEIILEDDELKHFRVMRLEEGEDCEVVNGKHQLATAEIKDIKKSQVTLVIKKVIKQDPPSQNVLCIPFLKAKKLELILEKATELSITEFWIYKADKSEIKELKKSQIERFEKILISALKQCGRLDFPKLMFYDSIQKIPNFNGLKFYGDTSEDAPLFYHHLTNDKPKVAIIGPESGLSQKEIAYLKKINFIGVKLSEFILRAETAAIASASLMSHASLIRDK